MVVPPDIDGLPPAELRQLLLKLLEENAELKRQNAELREEIARLKGLNGRPSIKLSGMENSTAPKPNGRGARRRRRGKVVPRVKVEEQILKAEVPEGSRFKGYEDFVVQDLELRARVIGYRRERWVTPDGQTVIAPLPPNVRGHFGPALRRFVLMQYHQGQVTVPRLVALLQAMGLAISKRQVMRLLITGQDEVLAEARDVLRVGLETARWIRVDDTGHGAEIVFRQINIVAAVEPLHDLGGAVAHAAINHADRCAVDGLQDKPCIERRRPVGPNDVPAGAARQYRAAQPLAFEGAAGDQRNAAVATRRHADRLQAGHL